MATKYTFFSVSVEVAGATPGERFVMDQTQALNSVTQEGAVYVVVRYEGEDVFANIAAWHTDPAKKISPEAAQRELRLWLKDHSEFVERVETNEIEML